MPQPVGETIPGYPTAIRPAQVTDGLSNTLVISESWYVLTYTKGKSPLPRRRCWASI